MTTKKMIMAGLVACCCIAAKAQDAKNEEPKGKAIVQVFGNFHTGFGADNDDRGFDLDRSYLGYQYNLGKGLSVKGVMDIGKSSDVGDYQRIAYIKNAMVTWTKGRLTLNGGLISTTQFNMQEKHWGYRYIYKSFQDNYKFGSSADLGLSASYKLAPWISADAIVVNGEGYKKVQKNDGLLYGLGAEYNIIQDTGNKEDADQYGLSVYGSLKAAKNIDIFARYDNLSSKDDWNEATDEQAVVAGLQLKLGKYVKLAPNFRMAIPKADGKDNKYSAYVSCYFGL